VSDFSNVFLKQNDYFALTNSFYENKKYPLDPWSGIFIGWLRQGSNAS